MRSPSSILFCGRRHCFAVASVAAVPPLPIPLLLVMLMMPAMMPFWKSALFAAAAEDNAAAEATEQNKMFPGESALTPGKDQSPAYCSVFGDGVDVHEDGQLGCCWTALALALLLCLPSVKTQSISEPQI